MKANKAAKVGLEALLPYAQARTLAGEMLDALDSQGVVVVRDRAAAITTATALIQSQFQSSRKVDALVSQAKSKEVAGLSRDRQVARLHEWLDKNIDRYHGRLELCANDALTAIGEARGVHWIKKQISAYRKARKFANR